MVIRLNTKDERIYEGLFNLKTTSQGILPNNHHSKRILNNLNQNNQLFFEQKANKLFVRRKSDLNFEIYKRF
jgi:hypothetical protein